MKNNTLKQVIDKCLFLLIVLVFSMFQIQAQPLIDKTIAPYPFGTSSNGCPGISCEITLPAIAYGELYTLNVFLDGTLSFGSNTGDVEIDTVYTNSNCPELLQTTTYTVNKTTGTIDIIPGQYCSGDDIYLEIKVNANDHDGATDEVIFILPLKRLPVKTVFVLDISGSMGTMVTAANETRWDVLKKSVEVYNVLNEFFKKDGDEIGLSYFTTDVIQPNPPIGSGFIELTAYDAVPSTTDTLIKDMNSRGPLAATAMGKGLLDAKGKLKSDVTNKYRKIAVLFTDGYQNIDPKVDINNGNSFTGVGSSGQFLNDFELDNVDSIRYYTIATWGAAAGSTPIVLSNIATNSNGHALVSTNTNDGGPGNDVFDYFYGTLENILHGGSPQVVGNKFGTLSNNEVSDTFHINSDITKAIFVLTHDDNDEISITVEKDRVDVTDLCNIKGNSFYKTIGLVYPLASESLIHSKGKYVIKLSATTQNFYELTCIVDDHLFNYECSMDKAIYKTGDVMSFNANLKYAGNTFTDNNDSVKVVILKPGDDINHLLATYEVPDLVYTDDGGSPTQQKLEYLYENNPDFYDALLSDNQIIDLNNQGNGNFTGEYTDTYVTGIYEIVYLVKIDDVSKGYIYRKDIQSAVFQFGQSNPLDIDEVVDDIAPTAPSNLVSSNITQSVVDVNWQASIDDSGISDYEVHLNGNSIASITVTNYTVTNLSPGSSYELYITATDPSGNTSIESNSITVNTLEEVDDVKPTTPENFAYANIAQTSIYLSWKASSDANGIKEYIIYKNNEPLVNTDNINYSIIDLMPNTSYSFNVAAIDYSDNESELSQIININTLDVIKDITAPSNLIAQDIRLRTLNLVWDASISNSGILEYLVYKDGSLIATTASTDRAVGYLNPSTEYKFHIIARDNNGDLSEASNYISVKTLSKSIGNLGIRIFKFRPKNKFGYYLGPGFKSMIKCKYLPKKPREPIAQKTSLQDETVNESTMGVPFVKEIVEKLDGTYYVVLANVPPKANPSIEIMFGDEILHSGPIASIPIWFYIILILMLILIIFMRKNKKSILYKIIWFVTILLLIIIILHNTGQLNFLYMI